jgi:hypothetical protein
LAAALKGRHARERAAMLGAHIIGFAVIRVALASRGDRGLRQTPLERLLKTSLAATLRSR